MCRGTKVGQITKCKLTTTIDTELYDYIENARGSTPRSTYVNAMLRNSMDGVPTQC